jgi:hypothetical protein
MVVDASGKATGKADEALRRHVRWARVLASSPARVEERRYRSLSKLAVQPQLKPGSVHLYTGRNPRFKRKRVRVVGHEPHRGGILIDGLPHPVSPFSLLPKSARSY